MNEGVSAGREEAIVGHGGEVVRVEGSYDRAVQRLHRDAEEKGYFVISDQVVVSTVLNSDMWCTVNEIVCCFVTCAFVESNCLGIGSFPATEVVDVAVSDKVSSGCERLPISSR